MFSMISRRWLAGTGLGLVMVANLAGIGSASAQTMPGTLTAQGLSGSASPSVRYTWLKRLPIVSSFIATAIVTRTRTARGRQPCPASQALPV